MCNCEYYLDDTIKMVQYEPGEKCCKEIFLRVEESGELYVPMLQKVSEGKLRKSNIHLLTRVQS